MHKQSTKKITLLCFVVCLAWQGSAQNPPVSIANSEQFATFFSEHTTRIQDLCSFTYELFIRCCDISWYVWTGCGYWIWFSC